MPESHAAEIVRASRCPACGGADLTVRCDAYVDYIVSGFDAEGFPVLSHKFDIQTFDDHMYICDGCGFEDRDVGKFKPDEGGRGRCEIESLKSANSYEGTK